MFKRWVPNWFSSGNDEDDGGGVDGPAVEVQEPEPVDKLELSHEQKIILKSTWNIIYSMMGHSLCYVGETSPEGSGNSRGVADTFIRLFQARERS